MLWNWRFSLGVVLIVANFLIGKLALPLLAIDTELGLAVYLISWAMLIAGVALCGREGLIWAHRYYHDLKARFRERARLRREMLEKSLHEHVRLRDNGRPVQPAVDVEGGEKVAQRFPQSGTSQNDPRSTKAAAPPK